MFTYVWNTQKKEKEINDNDAENFFLAEKWHYHSTFANMDLLKNSLISFKFYYETQKYLNYYCTEDIINSIIESKKLDKNYVRKIIRAGVPLKFTKDLILKLCNVEKNSAKENYKTRFAMIFKKFDPKHIKDHVPYLTFLETLQENLEIHFLNESGLEQVKQLLWLLYTLVPSIDYCPMLIKLISLLLVFMNEAEVYSVCQQILLEDYNDKESTTLRFKLRFNVEDNKKLVYSFIDCIPAITANMGKQFLQKFSLIGFKFEKLVEDMFFNLFVGYFNIHVLQRILLLYINEGCKTLFRVAYALLKHCRSEIMDCSDSKEIYRIIKNKGNALKEFDSFFATAFALKLTRHNNRFNEVKLVDKLDVKRTNCPQHTSFYIPSISDNSKIISDEEILSLWKIFPENLKMKDAGMIFSTALNGFDLAKLYEHCKDPKNSGFYCFLIVQTKETEVFGAILSAPFDIQRTVHYRPAYSCLFSLKPVAKRFEEAKLSDKVVYNSIDKLIFGDGANGPAIQIDKEIVVGYNFHCDLFNSECFLKSGKNTFEIENLELFVLY